MTRAEQVHQQLILDHARERHGFGNLPSGHRRTGVDRQHNPLCGDEVTLEVEVAASRITALAWVGDGCSISQASTSVLHDLVLGHDVAGARQVAEAFRDMVRARGRAEPDEALLGDAVAFAGVGRHANRVRCAMLGWTALDGALLTSAAPAEGTDDD